MAGSGWRRRPVIDIGGGRPPLRLPALPRPGGGALRLALVLLGLFILAFTSYYQNEADEVAVVQRFGKYVRTTEPGPHLKIPFGVETVTKVPVQRQLKEEFGFETVSADVRSQFRTSPEQAQESSMLTGDLNVAVVEWIVQYRIKDPKLWLFHLRDPKHAFRDMSEAAMRKVVGDHSVDEVLTIGREAIAL